MPIRELLEKRRRRVGHRPGHDRLRELCADPDIDAVVIATPNFTHRAIAVAAAQAGKHVMCEKPLGLNAGEVQRDVPRRPARRASCT